MSNPKKPGNKPGRRMVAEVFADRPAKIHRPKVAKHEWPVTDGIVHPVTIKRKAS